MIMFERNNGLIRRVVQRAGVNTGGRQLRWRDGICLRLPGRFLIVARRR